MATASPELVLTPFPQKERLLVLRATDAMRFCRKDGCQQVPQHQAESCLPEALWRDPMRVRGFLRLASPSSIPVSRLDDLRVFETLRKLVRSGDLVVVRQSEQTEKAAVPSLLQQRKLVRSIESTSRSSLAHEGRKYRLVADMDLRQVPNRDSYEVVNRDEAVRVLHALAQNAEPGLASLLADAGRRLTNDWRPPLTPDGLVLLRRSAAPVAPVAPVEAALSPSQLAKLHEPEWGVAASAELEDPFELDLATEIEAPFELETGAEVEAPPDEPADDQEAAA
jgi:hypothetical protein